MIDIKAKFLIISGLTFLICASTYLTSSLAFCDEAVGGVDEYNNENIKEETENILNEFVAEKSSQVPEQKEEVVWNGSDFLQGEVEYTELIQKQKEDEYYAQIASMFEGTAFVLDLEKYKETGDLHNSLTVDYDVLWGKLSENKDDYKEKIEEMIPELEKAINSSELKEFLEELFSSAQNAEGE